MFAFMIGWFTRFLDINIGTNVKKNNKKLITLYRDNPKHLQVREFSTPTFT